MKPMDDSMLARLLEIPGDKAKMVALDMILEQLPSSDQAAFASEFSEGRISIDRVREYLQDRPTWEKRCSPSQIDTIKMRVDRINKTIKRKNGKQWSVVVGPEIRTKSGDKSFTVSHDVSVYGPPYPQVVPGYRLIGIISSAYEKGDVRDADGQLLHIVPGGEDRCADLSELIGKAHVCSHCGISRKRNHLFVAEGPEKKIMTFGGDCAESYIPNRQEVEEMLKFLDASRGPGGMIGEQEGGYKIGWSPCSVVRYVISECDRDGKWISARDGMLARKESDYATYRKVLNKIWPWWSLSWNYTCARGEDRGDLETSMDASENINHQDVSVILDNIRDSSKRWISGERSKEWIKVMEWCEARQDGSEFWTNCKSAMNANCVTWRTIGIVSAVAGIYWKEFLSPKEKTLPGSWKAAFELNNGNKMTVKVLAALCCVNNIEDAQIEEMSKAGLIKMDEDGFISILKKERNIQPIANGYVDKSKDFDKYRSGDSVITGGYGTIISVECKQSQFYEGTYWSYVVNLDIGPTIIFHRSKIMDGGESINMSRLRIDSCTFKKKSGSAYIVTRVFGEIV